MNMDGWCRNMEKYGNPGCHRLSLTESALGAQSSRGGCILICCIMTTGIDNILISWLRWLFLYQQLWSINTRNLDKTNHSAEVEKWFKKWRGGDLRVGWMPFRYFTLCKPHKGHRDRINHTNTWPEEPGSHTNSNTHTCEHRHLLPGYLFCYQKRCTIFLTKSEKIGFSSITSSAFSTVPYLAVFAFLS